MFKEPKLYKQQLSEYKSLGRDITKEEYEYIVKKNIVDFFFSLCKNQVYCDKYFIDLVDEKGNSKTAIQTWNYQEFINKLQEINKEGGNLKNKYRIKSGKFPYTYIKLREFGKEKQNFEEIQEYAIEINTPPIELYEKDLNIKF